MRLTPVKTDQHGTTTGYDYGCRCDECRGARRERARTYREAHREQERERSRVWAQKDREQNPQPYRDATMRHLKKHPEQAPARQAVNNEVRSGDWYANHVKFVGQRTYTPTTRTTLSRSTCAGYAPCTTRRCIRHALN